MGCVGENHSLIHIDGRGLWGRVVAFWGEAREGCTSLAVHFRGKKA